MLAELLPDRAAPYVSGAMTAPDRENFELILTFHDALRTHVAGLQEVANTVFLTHAPALDAAPAALKTRLLGTLATLPPPPEPDALLVTGGDGLVEWASPAFTAMCGFSLEELRGRKPGRLLQGPDTDEAAVHRIRTALRQRRTCRETLVNYHKDGTRYHVSVAITPILDDAEQPLWFVAQERRLSAPPARGASAARP